MRTNEIFAKKRHRNLAKILDVSEPTITRMRKKLEASDYFSEYTVIPNLAKLGFEILAFTFLNMARSSPEPSVSREESMQKTHRWIEKNKNVVFSGTGEGIRGKNSVMVSLHRDFTDYTRFISEFRRQWSKNILDVESLIVILKGKKLKSFTLRHLEQPE